MTTDVEFITHHAILPTRESEESAGFDLYSAYDYVVEPRNRILVLTDLKMDIRKGYYGRIAPRSGLALESFIDIGGGVVDSDYRGNIGVIVFNLGTKLFHVKRGLRIAQIIFEKIYTPVLRQVPQLKDDKRGSNRGAHGFGSTGMFQKLPNNSDKKVANKKVNKKKENSIHLLSE